ncbi:MAG: hypothetical protein E6R09_14350 [Rhodocyclaceae bacterium]|nr:MAG: hypothetical protein E6R09_14350 [Rhodocyclaceae bacterium]
MLLLSKDLVPEYLPFKAGVDLSILSPAHTIYIARQLALAFGASGKSVQISVVEPDSGWGDGAWFVICPQAYESLPPVYVAYQLEQSGSSKHFTERYLSRLRQAVAVWDYSSQNVGFLIENGVCAEKIKHVPISYTLDPNPVVRRDYDFDVAFYGDVNNERRRLILARLGEKFNLKIVSGVYGGELYAQLERARCVVNIHYYDDALLETTRIYECLSMNLCVVSERGRDQVEHGELDGVVDFVDVGDVQGIIDAVAAIVVGGDESCYLRQLNNQRLLVERGAQRACVYDNLIANLPVSVL